MMKDKFPRGARYVGRVETEDVDRVTASYQGTFAGRVLWRAGAEME